MAIRYLTPPNFVEQSAPATPATSSVVLYAKSDGLLYSKDDAGVETLVSGGSGATFPLLAPNGLVSAPSYAFTNDVDSGLYLNAVGDVRLAVGGVWKFAGIDDGTNGSSYVDARGTGSVFLRHGLGNKLVINSADMQAVVKILGGNGSVTAPMYGFTNDTDTGMFLNLAGDLRFTVAGSQRLILIDDGTNGEVQLNSRGTGDVTVNHGGVNKLTVNTSTAAAAVPITSTGAITSNLGQTYSIILDQNGTAAAITFGVGSVSNTGTMLIQHQFDSLQIPNGKMLSLARANVIHAGDIGNQIGDKLALFGPTTDTTRYGLGIQSASFVMYMPPTSALSIRQAAASSTASAGTVGITLSSTGLVRALDATGTQTAPSYSWLTDTNTGMYNFAADTIGFTTDGTVAATINSTGVLNAVDGITIATNHDVQVMDWMTVAP